MSLCFILVNSIDVALVCVFFCEMGEYGFSTFGAGTNFLPPTAAAAINNGAAFGSGGCFLTHPGANPGHGGPGAAAATAGQSPVAVAALAALNGGTPNPAAPIDGSFDPSSTGTAPSAGKQFYNFYPF